MQGAHCQQLQKITTETAVIQKIKKTAGNDWY